MAFLRLFNFTDLADAAVSKTDDWFVSSEDTIDTGAGNDTIQASGRFWGISNFGTINTGTGNDSIIGGDSKLLNGSTSGTIVNHGTISTGSGNDIIIGHGKFSHGINNNGTILTGSGNDIIKGVVVTGGGGFKGIINFGTIKTGRGNDVVDALKGGFLGSQGRTYLGSGRDTLKGFGTGSFYGGKGRDKILLGEGTYQVSNNSINIFSDSINPSANTMFINGFEQIGGVNGGLFAINAGVLTVNAAGVGNFAPK